MIFLSSAGDASFLCWLMSLHTKPLPFLGVPSSCQQLPALLHWHSDTKTFLSLSVVQGRSTPLGTFNGARQITSAREKGQTTSLPQTQVIAPIKLVDYLHGAQVPFILIFASNLTPAVPWLFCCTVCHTGFLFLIRRQIFCHSI